MSIAIKVTDLSKAYQLGQFSTGTISRDIERWWALVRGKEDPYLKIGETNDRTSKSKTDIVWSLKDINFEIEKGSSIGIIGKNGAGKSTLLKVLSQVTSPTAGRINIKGRIASLLEVGTGFHPELTGRENIYLNGAILGMRKKEITKKFDEIVDFAGVERYIDTPVKRYSSGMYVRLAFAVAAHLESEILIVDEVLAVGDAEFQKKCLGKMGDVSKTDGRTIIFVSHNMDAIIKLCQKSILIDKGRLKHYDTSHKVIGAYLNNESELKKDKLIVQFFDSISPKIKLLDIRINDNAHAEIHLNTNQSLTITYCFVSTHDINVIPFASVFSNTGELVFISSLLIDNNNKTYAVKSGITAYIKHEILMPNLNAGEFYLSFGFADPGYEGYLFFDKSVKLIPQSQYTIGLNGYFSSISKVEFTQAT